MKTRVKRIVRCGRFVLSSCANGSIAAFDLFQSVLFASLCIFILFYFILIIILHCSFQTIIPIAYNKLGGNIITFNAFDAVFAFIVYFLFTLTFVVVCELAS
jgi:hypothetical protein